MVRKVAGWASTAREILAKTKANPDRANGAAQALSAQFKLFTEEGVPQFLILPTTKDNLQHLKILHNDRELIPTSDREFLQDLASLESLLPSSEAYFKRLGGILGRRDKEEAVERLLAYYHRDKEVHGRHRLTTAERLAELQLVTRETSFYALLSELPGARTVIGRGDWEFHRQVLADSSGFRKTLTNIIGLNAQLSEASETALKLGRKLQEDAINLKLINTSLTDFEERAKAVPAAKLEAVSLFNVLDILHQSSRLIDAEGVGQVRANAILQAAIDYRADVALETPVLIDPGVEGGRQYEMLVALCRYRFLKRYPALLDLAPSLNRWLAIAQSLDSKTHELLVLENNGPNAFNAALKQLGGLPARYDKLEAAWQPILDDPMGEFEANSTAYYQTMTDLGIASVDAKTSYGALPEDVIELVEAQSLNTDFLNVNLRPYQEFGAKFALAQKKIILGDEMGLGKTVESLAVLSHLAQAGHTHFLVVCPASVLINWERETRTRSQLLAHRLHGSDFDQSMADWATAGGVGVTTYETLRRVNNTPSGLRATALIVDEAHYIKNPRAQRTQATLVQLSNIEYAMLLSGTPLENKLDEFKTLASYVKPDLRLDATELEAAKFRIQISPVYLRRNQEDVLKELPQLVEKLEWLPMNEADRFAYDEAVLIDSWSGAWSRMRRAVTMAGPKSSKLIRMQELVDKAKDNGRRVLIFTYFLDTMNAVHASLPPGSVFGPISGALAPEQRQAVIDEFSKGPAGSVLLSQITAGGTGLNIQSASVVIIMEPQLKPSIEAQAIARAHRMGQTHSVQVHRLLSLDSVDETVHELLQGKQAIFQDFARQSEIAESSESAKRTEVLGVSPEQRSLIVAKEKERVLAIRKQDAVLPPETS